MNRWTNSAKNRLEEYFARLRCDLQRSGADVEEVTADLLLLAIAVLWLRRIFHRRQALTLISGARRRSGH